jgi:hypothetical protein
MDNLNSVTFRQSYLGPVFATNHALIDLNRDPRRLERQLADQIAQHRSVR